MNSSSVCNKYAVSIHTNTSEYSNCWFGLETIASSHLEGGNCDKPNGYCSVVPDKTNAWLESCHHAMEAGIRQKYPNVFWDGRIAEIRLLPRMDVMTYNSGTAHEITIKNFPTHKSIYHNGQYEYGFAQQLYL